MTTKPTVLTGANQAIATDPCLYLGFTVKETTGTTTASFVIWDNDSAASGTPLEEVTLLANESTREWFVGGKVALQGIYVQVVSGSIAGSVFWS